MALTRLSGSQFIDSNANILVGTGVTVNSTGLILAGAGVTIRRSDNNTAIDVQVNSNKVATAQFSNGGGSAPAVVHIVDPGNASDHYGLFVGGSSFGNFTTNPVLVTKNTQVGIGSTLPTASFKLDINGDLSLGEAAGTDNTYIDQKQNGGLRLINSGRLADNGEIGVNKYNNISGDTTYYRDFTVYDGKNRLMLITDGSTAETRIGIGDTGTLTVSPNRTSGTPNILVDMGRSNGEILIGDKYFGTESQTNWGVGYSDSHTVIGAFCGPHPTSQSAFVSTVDVFSAWHSALSFGGGGLNYYQETTNTNTAVGTAVTMVSKFGVNTSGHVTKPYQPSFYARNSGAESDTTITWIGSGSPYFNNADSAGNTHFNASTGRFTAPVTGKYVFAASIMSDNTNRSYHYWYFTKNGSQATTVHHSHSNSGESYRTTSGTAVLSLAANDYVTIYIYGTTYGSGWCSFTGWLLG